MPVHLVRISTPFVSQTVTDGSENSTGSQSGGMLSVTLGPSVAATTGLLGEGAFAFFFVPASTVPEDANQAHVKRHKLGTTSDCKRQSASDKHGHQVEHVTRRVWGDMVLRNT